MEPRMAQPGSDPNSPPVAAGAEGCQLDLALLMVRIQKVEVLTQPLLRAAAYLKVLRRWEEKQHCLVILVCCNFSCFIMPTAYNLVLALAAVLFCATMGFMHRRSQCLMKVFPNSNIKHDDLVGEHGPITHVDVLRQYKAMLFQLDNLVQWYIRHANQVYAVLKWDDLEVSIRWYLVTTMAVLTLHLLPLRWCVTMLVNLFLLEHKAFTALRDSRLWAKLGKQDDMSDKSDCISVDSQDSPSTDLDPMTFSRPDDTDSEGSDAEKVDTSGPDDESDVEDEGTDQLGPKASTSKGGVVGKILEFKKKHQSANGNCVGCNVQFSTILKRRHICSHCGNHFCSRCCSNKVPRSMFGATSPAAQTETVPVCGFCYMYLTGKKDPSFQEKAAEREKEKDGEKSTQKEKDGEKEKEKMS